MKVLLVSALPPPAGGIAVWTERYLDYCKEHSVDVELVNIALSGSRRIKFNDKTNLKDEIVRSKRVLRDMNKQLDKVKPTVVHMNTSCGPFGIFRDLLCVKAAKNRNLPIVLHFHCNVENRVHGKAGMWALKQMTRMASQVLVLNTSSLRFVAPFAKKTPRIVPNFISSDFLVSQHEIRDSIKEIVFVGHVQVTKGSREILQAADKLPDIHFTLIGPVADEIRSLPCPQNVSMLGQKDPDDIKQYLINADVYLFPSYTEGFSLSLTEAMATGLPAIATDVGANRDMLEGMGGVIIPTHDSNAIVNAIKEMESPAKRKVMSEWSINKVINNYQTNTVMSGLIETYKTIAKNLI